MLVHYDPHCQVFSNTLMLGLVYMFLLLAMLNMFLKTNRKFLEKVAKMVGMKHCCCASHREE